MYSYVLKRLKTLCILFLHFTHDELFNPLRDETEKSPRVIRFADKKLDTKD